MNEEIWQVEANGEVYEANLKTLKEWIAEGAVLPTDKVRVGDKRFVQARLIPQLASLFKPAPSVAAVAVVAESVAPKLKLANASAEDKTETLTQISEVLAQRRAVQEKKFSGETGNSCVIHEHEPAAFICKTCKTLFCKACPKSYGSVKICLSCGDMCEEITVAQTKSKKAAKRLNAGGAVDFGAEDFGKSWIYPFKFTTTLLFGALFVAVLSFGGVIGGLLANMLVFGCISQTINQISQGNSERSFMPDFDDFSIWDDMLKPVFLSIGISLVSWLPAILTMFLLVYVTFSSIATSVSQMPGTEINLARTDESKNQAEKRSFDATMQAEESGNVSREELDRKFEEYKTAPKINAESDEAAKNTTEEFVYQMFTQNFQKTLKNALPFALLFLVAGAWGLFYSPIALAIAGYTRSFRATINPLVGLDTIRRMGGGTYFKVLLMVLSAQVLSFIVALIIGVITSPLSLPILGNLPAKFIVGITTFYFSLVIASILGLALYKTADRLGIEAR